MKKTPILHPFFFTIYAILGVYAQNPQELPVEWILRPLLILLGIAVVFYLLVRKWTGDHQRAGLIITLFLAWLFSGHIRNVLATGLSITPTFLQDILFLAGWGLLLIFLGSTWLWAKIKVPELVTNFLNVTSWVVILLPTYFIIVFTGQAIKQAEIIKSNAPLTANQVNLSSTGGTLPDIYVIILDAYGREDFLNDVFEFDNRDFTNFLRERGFYVAEQSRPNYPQTQLSLSSLLNLQYMNGWAKRLEKTNYRPPLTEAIRHSEVRRALTEIGYQTINVPNSTFISNIEDGDIYLPMSAAGINQFEGMILSTTALNIFAQKWELGLPIPGYANQRKTIQHQLDTLKTIPSLPGPKFVFVHILAPHPPFVFDKDGNPVQTNALFTLGDGGGFPGTIAEYEEGYRQQITYINKQMMEVIDVILEKSTEQSIIVLQGDHGPGSRFSMLELEDVNCLWERYSILNAYYFPNKKYNLLYPSITPVNSFRVIFNTYFGAELQLWEDKNYYASYANPYQMIDVTDRIMESCPVP